MSSINDLTVKELGLIDSPESAIRFVCRYHEDNSTGIATVIRCDSSMRAIGVTHLNTDLDIAWRLGVVYDAKKEPGCYGVVVVIHKDSKNPRPYSNDIDVMESLGKELKSEGFNLTDVIVIGNNGRYFSFSTERMKKIMKSWLG